jgi:hypothetical protein
MNIEERVRILENKVAQLSEAFLNAQRQNVPVVSKVDDTANKVVEITPYTQTKTAYIGDTEVTFTDVPLGNLSVFIEDSQIAYGVMRDSDRVTVDFIEPLEDVTTVTISIM